jgi:2,4-dienoyl-CoA reductase-like NADH-dependent reductase (Old Yellow Enzyme family)
MTISLDTPLDLPCGARLSNRLCKAALTEGLADPMNRANDKLERLYRLWSEGGAGLVLTGNVQVDRTHLEQPGNVVIDGNGGLEALKAYAKAGTVGGNHLWMQINHPGRQTPIAVNPNPLAPSAVPLKLPTKSHGDPRAATEEEILDVIRRFAHVATVARESGFTGVQIHGAHGYLISQFLSPIANQRTDAWGGSLENRARFVLEIARAIRKAVGPDYPIGLKINSSDFQQGGFSKEDAIAVVHLLNDAGIDLLELSGGTYEQPVMVGSGNDEVAQAPIRESTRKREAYFLEYAALIKPEARMPVMVTGGFRTKDGMVDALRSGAADVIGLGRPMCVDTDLPRRLIAGEIDRVPAWESVLKLDPGAAPDVSPDVRHQIETWGKQGWFCLQLIRIGEGKGADRDMGVFEAFNAYRENEAATAARLQR